ncbi:MAG TPA: hypothetical protein VGR89_15275 [Puia sp.]|nr:hypothetical protein [Puia sp.]
MITRDNYEEYFLLYADNELPAAERQVVERFVADHPDLREEWEAFLQCRISPEADLVFPGRESLFRPETAATSHTEDLLLYLDGELDRVAAARIESLLRQDPRISTEFAALQAALNYPDPAIVYPGKEKLYKKERTGALLSMPWVRLGIAASVAAVIAVLFLLPAKPVSPTRPGASANAAAAASGRSTRSKVVASLPADTHSRNFRAAVTFAGTLPLHKRTRRLSERRDPVLAVSLPERLAADPAGSGNRPAERIEGQYPIAPAAGGQSAGGVSTTEASVGDVAANFHPQAGPDIPKEQSSFATRALQEEANEERNSSFISDEPAATGKAKLRGLFRKVTRAFEKTADRDGDGNRQILVAAFPVSLN